MFDDTRTYHPKGFHEADASTEMSKPAAMANPKNKAWTHICNTENDIRWTTLTHWTCPHTAAMQHTHFVYDAPVDDAYQDVDNNRVNDKQLCRVHIVAVHESRERTVLQEEQYWYDREAQEKSIDTHYSVFWIHFYFQNHNLLVNSNILYSLYNVLCFLHDDVFFLLKTERKLWHVPRSPLHSTVTSELTHCLKNTPEVLRRVFKTCGVLWTR